jgi:hypothetical protein
MLTSPSRLLLGALAASLVLTTGCGDAAPTEAAIPSPRIAVYLTDAPGDVRKAVVTIDQVYLQGDGGRTVLRDEDLTVDLLTLADSVATLVPATGVPAGSYSGLHLVISGGYLEVEGEDGGSRIYASAPAYPGLPEGAQADGTLQMPSYARSGLKVQFPAGLEVGDATRHLLVDFDVSQSFGHQAGKSGAWVMTPVILGQQLEAPPADVGAPADSTTGA